LSKIIVLRIDIVVDHQCSALLSIVEGCSLFYDLLRGGSTLTEYCSSDFTGNGTRGPGLRDAMSILYTNFLFT